MNRLATLTFCLLAATPAFAQQKLNLANPGEIVFLTNPIYPPMEFVNPATGEMNGFDIDLGKAIARKLGLKDRWTQSAFAQLQSSLQTHRGDVILSGMSDNVKRQASMDFIDYVTTGPILFTLNSKAGAFRTPTDFCGKKIAGSRSTSFSVDVPKWSADNCVAKGKPAIIYEGTEDSNAARLGMKQGRYDGVVQGIETIAYQMKIEPNTYTMVGEPLFKNDVFGIAVSKNNPQLRAAIAGALSELIKSGEYGKLLAKWGLTRNAVSAVSINSAK
ncbi:MAG TPA: ABC transporter substrate-binding protein [Rhizomicrobium sp.]|jgi:polar amino acid transport system substrate-binding protein|nr:ABC transporter substrate-binding protein [Rhizomicrobium sp.]